MMSKMSKLKIQSIKHDTLWRKFLLSSILMSLIPILLLLYIVIFIVVPKTETGATQIKWLIFWIFWSALVGFWITRSLIRSFISISKSVKMVANGNYSTRLETDEASEINQLSESFNRITARLEANIKELQRSKKMMQDILSRVGKAVASFQDIDRFLELLLMTTVEAIGARNGKLMLLDKKNKELFTKISFGEEQIQQETVKVGEGILGAVIEKEKPIVLSRSESVYGTAIICVPLVYSKKVIGLIALNDKINGLDFSEDDLFILSDLASHISIALENYRLSQDVEKTYVETINALAMAVDARDPYTRGHSKRVGEYCYRIAKEFNLDDEIIKMLMDASVVHDIGKIGIPDEILHKTTPLTNDELKLIQQHVIIGDNILKPIRSFTTLRSLIRSHHERLNGKGYPDGLKAKDLSLPLNIMIVADAFDAMTSNRPYRQAMSILEAKKELKENSGTLFDKEVVDKFLKII
ncbi:MAG: HD domain-containing protein [Candidatus Omnitrophica bacterium]|nr:HD domain-containing protein [Candidatus Omnitrophota bacterium]